MKRHVPDTLDLMMSAKDKSWNPFQSLLQTYMLTLTH